MKCTNGRLVFWVGALSAIVGLRCGGEDFEGPPLDFRNPPTPEITTPGQADLRAELPNGVAEVVARRYRNPDVALASYAHVGIFAPGSNDMRCSGAMIGPNIMMTAAHCANGNNIDIAFRQYREENLELPDIERFACSHLLQTWYSSDLMLFYCEDNGDREAPGDKYGYLDFERRDPAVGTRLYSIWVNPLEIPMAGQIAHLFSEGRVASTTGRGWFTMDPRQVATVPLSQLRANGPRFERNIAIGSSVYGIGGASGSPQLSADTHRIVVGPTTSSSGSFRGGLSMNQYLRDGTVEPRDPTRVTLSSFSDLEGIDPWRFLGLLDKNRNRVIDIQEKIEWAIGERSRDHYWLGFESERRNALWTVGNNTQINAATKSATIRVDRSPTMLSSLGATLLRHDRLPLEPNTTYRVSVMTRISESDSDGRLLFRTLEAPSRGWLPSVASEVALPVDRHSNWRVSTFRLTGGDTFTFEIAARGRLRGEISSISLIAETSVMNFDTADKRVNWRNSNNGKRALILPDGRSAVGMPEVGVPGWAGLVTRDRTRPAGNDWPLANRQLALIVGERQRICFEARAYRGGLGASAGQWGAVRALSGGAEISRATFRPTTSWTSVCSAYFTPPARDNSVAFGTTTAATGDGASYLVDNIRIER